MKQKRVYWTLLLLMMMSLLSGCMNVSYQMNLNDNGTVDVKITMLYNDDSGELKPDSEKIEEIKQKFIDHHYTISSVNEKGLSGFEIIKEEISLEESNFIAEDEMNVDLLDDLLGGLVFSKGTFRNHYKLNAKIDLTNLMNQFVLATLESENQFTDGESVENQQTEEDYKKQLSQLNLKLIVSTKNGKVLQSNSTLESQDKKTTEWVLIPGDNKQVTMEAVTGLNKDTVGTTFILCVVGVLALSLIIILLLQYRKRNH